MGTTRAAGILRQSKGNWIGLMGPVVPWRDANTVPASDLSLVRKLIRIETGDLFSCTPLVGRSFGDLNQADALHGCLAFFVIDRLSRQTTASPDRDPDDVLNATLRMSRRTDETGRGSSIRKMPYSGSLISCDISKGRSDCSIAQRSIL